MRYARRNGPVMNKNGLKPNAALRSNRAMALNILVAPQPGHLSPVSLLNTQGIPKSVRSVKKRYAKPTASMIEYFLRVLRSLSLNSNSVRCNLLVESVLSQDHYHYIKTEYVKNEVYNFRRIIFACHKVSFLT